MDNNIFKQIDYLGYMPSLYIKSQQRYQTTVGALLTLFSLLVSAGLAAYFILQLVNQQGANIILNQINQNSSFLNLTETPFIISLSDASGKSINNPNIATVKFFQEGILPKLVNGTAVLQYVRNYIDLENCDISKHFGEHKSLYENTPLLNKYLCPAFNSTTKNNMTVIGKYGDGVNGYVVLKASVFKCVNSTSNNFSCASPAEINKQLGFVYFGVELLANQINNNDNNNPVQFYRTVSLQTLSSQLYKNYRTFFDNVEYTTDFGYVFEDLNVKTGFTQSVTIPDVSLSPPATSPNSLGDVSIALSGKLNTYNKSFIKLQNVMANIGGMAKLVFFVAGFIVEFISEKLYIKEMSEMLSETGKFSQQTNIHLLNNNSNNSNIPLRNNSNRNTLQVFGSSKKIPNLNQISSFRMPLGNNSLKKNIM